MPQLIEAKESTLAELLRAGCFKVPWHQRYYDWEEKHVTMLLHDLAEAVNEGSPCHFLGSIMLIRSNENDKWEINDGQQRIITFSLICAYLCKIFQTEGCSSEENHILRVLFDIQEAHNETLANAAGLAPRVTPPVNDKTNFNQLIRGHDIGSNGKMTAAWNDIVSFFENETRKEISWRKKMLDFMLNKVVVVQLEVDKSLDSHAIFETLNYRGKNLEQIDLIKNYFLSFFKDETATAQYDTVHDGFQKINTSFTSAPAAEYVRCYMQAKYGFINKEQFFRETRKRFGSPGKEKSQDVLDLVKNLARGAEIGAFKTLLRKAANQEFLQQLTKHARKTNNKRKIDDYLLDLHDYRIVRPIVFALFCHYSGRSTAEKTAAAKFVYSCTKLLSSFVQRIAHIGDFRPSAYEAKFANLAMKISNETCKNASDFFDELKVCDNAGVIDDKHYIEQMRIKFYQNKSVTKSGYVLKRIVEYQQMEIRVADSQTSIEHILPKSNVHNSKPAWASAFDSSDRDRLVHCLGNLTLLNKKENSPKDEDNESFLSKKEFFEKSSYQMTKDICKHSEWTPEIVRRRQLQLVKIAAKDIWNFNY